MHHVYLALGSNIGDKKKYLDSCIALLAAHTNIQDINASSYHQTVAVDVQSVQEDYLNAVVELNTSLSAIDLFDFTQDIEKRLGRHSKGDYMPRTMDIDIILYDNLIINEQDLQIPHPRFHQRLFVLEPLLELNAELMHPLLNKSIKSLYNEAYELDNL